jgi:cytochrome P450
MSPPTPATAALPPGPPVHPFTGNLAELRADRLNFLHHVAHTYGDFVPIRLLRRTAILLNRPDYIEEVLVTQKRHFIKARGTRSLRALLGNGLLVSEGDFWRRQRRLVQPAFHRDRVAAYSQMMVEYTGRMLARWQPGQTLDLHHEMMGVTLAIVAKALFDAEVSDAASDVGRSLEATLAHFNWRASNGFIIPLWLPVRANREFAQAKADLDKIVYGLITRRRASGEDPGDLLSMLLAARDDDASGTSAGVPGGMTDLQVRDEVMTLLLAGHETTANALTWAFLLLSQNPDVDAHLSGELATVLNGRSPALADLPHLPYTENVIKEALRLYPPAWIMGYEAVDDVTIGGYPVCKGTTMFMSQWVTHRDPRWFPEPDAFRPERWAEPGMKKLPTYAYYPFGGGERLCIGKSFALMEASLLLATIVEQYRLALAPGQVIAMEPSVTLRPKHGLKMEVLSR